MSILFHVSSCVIINTIVTIVTTCPLMPMASDQYKYCLVEVAYIPGEEQFAPGSIELAVARWLVVVITTLCPDKEKTVSFSVVNTTSGPALRAVFTTPNLPSQQLLAKLGSVGTYCRAGKDSRLIFPLWKFLKTSQISVDAHTTTITVSFTNKITHLYPN